MNSQLAPFGIERDLFPNKHPGLDAFVKKTCSATLAARFFDVNLPLCFQPIHFIRNDLTLAHPHGRPLEPAGSRKEVMSGDS